MNVFFDCDYTILSVDHVLRPRTRDIFSRLIADGHQVFLWSGEGARWGVVWQHSLSKFLSGVFSKPLRNFDIGLQQFKVTAVPDFVVDDDPAIVRHFGGYHIRQFVSTDEDDQELENVYQVVTELVATGRSTHPRWLPRTANSGSAV